MREYKKMLEKEAKKFKLTAEDLHNLYDLFHVVDTPKEINIDLRATLKINHMLKWFYKFHEKIEKIVIPELYKKGENEK